MAESVNGFEEHIRSRKEEKELLPGVVAGEGGPPLGSGTDDSVAERVSEYSNALLPSPEQFHGAGISCLCVYSLEKAFLAIFIPDIL